MFKDPLGWFPSGAFSAVFLLVFLGIYAVDGLLPWLVNRPASRPRRRADAGSFVLIYAAVLLGLGLAFLLRLRGVALEPAWAQYAGLGLALAGLLLRAWAMIVLGRFFSRMVAIQSGHQLITAGPYRWVRHPAYTGMLLLYIGFALCLGSWLGAAVTGALVLLAAGYRIRVEERALLAAFGEPYRQYMQRTGRLLPGL